MDDNKQVPEYKPTNMPQDVSKAYNQSVERAQKETQRTSTIVSSGMAYDHMPEDLRRKKDR